MKQTALILAALSAWGLAGTAGAGAKPPPAPALPEVLALDGTWEILFDRRNEGREAAWHRDAVFSAVPGRRNIKVPSCWEETEKDYEGVAFYRRTFVVPASWDGKVVRLHFDAVNFQAEVWLNDQAVGMHEGGFTPFEFRVERIIKAGRENTLTLRVAGPILMTSKRIEGVGPMETPQWRGAITGGIWQPVKLIATGDVHVKDVFVQPRIEDGAAALDVELDHCGTMRKTVDLDIAIRPASAPREAVAALRERLQLQPGPARRRYTMEIPRARFWSPDSPYLYQVDVSVACDGVRSDRTVIRFGMREFTIRDKEFCLNGKPFYLKATFFEGLYPVKLAYPDSREMAAREIRLAREAGFNMIRPWRKPPPPVWLDLADTMGVLTVGSMAIECMDFPVETARLPGWVASEVRQSILRDRNRACVVEWELFNELKRPVLKQMLHPMAMLARQLDPTRLILDESGGWAYGANMYLPYQSEPTKFNDIHDYPGQQINDEVYEKLVLAGSKTHEQLRAMGLGGRLPGRNVVPGLMTFFSELGYGSLPDLVEINRRFEKTGNPIVPPTIYHRRLAEQHRRVLKESGFDRIYPDLKRFCLDEQRIHGTANKRMIEAVRCNPRVRGYCIHALTAGDWIIGAGLLDLFRSPKTYAYEGTRAANQPRIVSIRVRPRNVYAERGATIEVTGVNEKAGFAAGLKLQVVSAGGTVVYEKAGQVDLPAGITRLFQHQLDTRLLSGTYTVTVRLTASDGSLVTENHYDFDVFAAPGASSHSRRVAVLDPFNALKPFLKRSGIEFAEFQAGAGRRIPVLVSRTVARTPAERKRFRELAEFVRSGGTAIYLQGGGPKVPWGKSGKASPLLPVSLRVKRTMGHWICIPRLVNDHPVFRGLPVNCMMGAVYENVWAQSTLLDVQGETMAGSIGYDWFPDYDSRKRHYYGPGDTWWGSDMAVVEVGAGRCILCQLRLVENLGKDPVADRIVSNLIQWAAP